MDPRKADYQAGRGKRVASRSPDRSKGHKLAKANPPGGSSTPVYSKPPSRASSSSNGTGRQTMQPPSAADARGASAQLQTDLRRESGMLFVNSPDSLGSKRSQYEDATSGRSTPLSVGGTMTRQGVPPPPPPPPPMTLANAEADPLNPIESILMQFNHFGTNITKLSQSQSQWEARLKRADLEHESMAKNYAAFPQLREQKTAAQKYAQEQLRLLSKDLEEQTEAQRAVVRDIATLLQSAEVKPSTLTATDTSAALAEEMQQLRTDMAKMKSDIAASASAEQLELLSVQTGRMSSTVTASASHGEVQQLRAQIAKIESKAVNAPAYALAQELQQLRTQVNRLEPDVADAKKKASQAVCAAGQTPKFQGDIKRLQDTDANRKREVDALRSDVQRIKDRGSSREAENMPQLASDIQELQVSNTARRSEVDVLRSEFPSATDRMTKQEAKINVVDVKDLASNVETIRGRLDAFDKFVMGEGGEHSNAPLNNQSSLVRKVEQALEATKTLEQEIARLHADLHEDGKPSLVKRVKKHDMMLNDLANDVKDLDEPHGPLNKRVKSLGKLVDILSKDVKEKAAIAPPSGLPVPAPSPTSPAPQSAADPSNAGGSSADLRAYAERLQRIERLSEEFDTKLNDALKEADEFQDKRDEAVVADMGEKLDTFTAESTAALHAAITAAKEDVAGWRSEDTEALNKSLAEVKTVTNELATKIAAVQADIRGDVQKALRNVRASHDTLTANLALKSDKDFVVPTLDLLKKSIDEVRAAAKTSRTPTPCPGRRAASSLPHDTFPPTTTMANGFHPQVNGSSPKVNGYAPTDVAPPVAEALWEKLNGLTNITNQLRSRFDNLTTDDMVAKMLDQFASVWPHAKRYEDSFTTLQAHLAGFGGQVVEIRAQMQQAVERSEAAKDLPGKFETALMGFEMLKASVRAVEERVAESQGTVNALKEVVEETLLAKG
ncbi:hypothetical protein B0A55_01609 [Friedmanniomyces simplex]|uniref:Uncharacterized protein n=1 Tax=Friedmanniomyces simplex TaxID=329884 RepID=A0A4U0XVN0_9PEZI|nr:hypothetical protein B0A55_01609 [Friedmanniomyces simplex]